MTHQLRLIVPPRTVTFYGAGERCTDAKDGDFLLVDHGNLTDTFIGAGQDLEAQLDPQLAGYTWARHIAYIRYDQSGAMVSQMGRHGYERVPLATYDAAMYAVARFNVGTDAVARANSYDEACADVEYNFEDYLPLTIDGLTRQEFQLTLGDALICSAHCTLVGAGLGLFADRPAALVIPARFAMWTGARPTLAATKETP